MLASGLGYHLELPVNQTVAQGPRALPEGRQDSKKVDVKEERGQQKAQGRDTSYKGS